ncbi:MAG TPA: FAD-binding oxidoreductase [Baekduia sp.]|uniref:FAD-binding oxidoreductase n=1 Tax=Baekduia sp. TaxID=2600305 RepID=UPI002C08183D|nr:FAD-binding oxidoreductase [Baekduia sp.]HMJ34231.1 FAD-binding oxidoreductase [Baekduia sp.]
MSTRPVRDAAIDELKDSFQGRVIAPRDEGYDEARTLFNAMIDRRPAVIAQCASPEDVTAAVRFGRERDLPTAVRSGGHSVAGMSTVDDGLVVDVRPMKGIAVDPARRTVRCGAGVTWAELDQATQEHGLATTGGRVSTTGVAGFTLGGGSGWLERKHGLACDNLIAVELVTADGEQLRASDSEHPDLFWALHGGGGNFGVATAFEFRVHPVGPIVMAGLMLWPGDRGREVLEVLRESMAEGPDELALAVVYVSGPPEEFVPPELQGQLCCVAAVFWAGEDPAGGEPHAARFRALDPAVDLVGPMPYTEFQRMIDDPPGLRNYWTADYLDALSDEAIEVFAADSERMPVPGACQSIMFPWGGQIARVAPGDTPMARREARWVAHPFALWQSPDDDERYLAWARGISADLKPFGSGGVYLNFIGDEGQDRVRAAFGDDYERLAQIKAQYDPDNVFHFNQNIEPARAAGVT